jgi:caffeoyl-CoA O-methyltransferase
MVKKSLMICVNEEINFALQSFPMNFLPEEIENYVETHTKPESELLAKLNNETWQKVVAPRMLSGHFQGRVLSMLSKMIRPKRILEIGTYTGYSALCLTEGLADDGLLITIDINDELQWIQDKYFLMSPLGKKIERHFGNALTLIPELKEDFDIVFMDADKENYIHYYHLLIDRLKSGAYILIDNVLWSGKVITTPHPNDVETKVLQELNDMITKDPRVENVLLPIRDGLMVLRKI